MMAGFEGFLVFPQNARYLRGESGYAQYGSSANVGCLTAFLIPFVLVALGLVVLTLISLRERVLLMIDSAQTTGVVTERSAQEGDDGIIYHLTYEFRVGDQTYQRRQQVDSTTYWSFETSRAAEIVYVSAEPTISRLRGTDSGAVDLFLLGFTVIWCLIVGVFVVTIDHMRKRMKRLKRDGRPVHAELISITGHDDSDGDYQVTLVVQFKSPASLQLIRGERTYQVNHLKSGVLPSAGAPVVVIYADDEVWEVM
jgi:hypothetical protein